jgi:hypothetical protein
MKSQGRRPGGPAAQAEERFVNLGNLKATYGGSGIGSQALQCLCHLDIRHCITPHALPDLFLIRRTLMQPDHLHLSPPSAPKAPLGHARYVQDGTNCKRLADDPCCIPYGWKYEVVVTVRLPSPTWRSWMRPIDRG